MSKLVSNVQLPFPGTLWELCSMPKGSLESESRIRNRFERIGIDTLGNGPKAHH